MSRIQRRSGPARAGGPVADGTPADGPAPAIDPIPREAIAHARALRDLTDRDHGTHAMQQQLERLQAALGGGASAAPPGEAVRARTAAPVDVRIRRADPVVDVADNYDRLHYPPEAITRDARYSRYVGPGRLLRTHTTAMIPPALRELAGEAQPPGDVVLVCPGLVYRRDAIDRLHTGTPHQVDVWRLLRGQPLGTADLRAMVRHVIGALLPGRRLRTTPATHPYTQAGLQIDVEDAGRWIEVGECGLALPALLEEAGLSASRWSGLAMGLGLDRVLMLAKGIDDIRLLRSDDPRVAGQMQDLSPYRPVSSQPPIRRDLSIAVAVSRTPEELGDRVRQAMAADADALEAVEVLNETPGDALPPAAVARIGLQPGQKNVLLRLVIRHPTRTLTAGEANRVRDAVYAALHEGTAWQWAAPAARARRRGGLRTRPAEP
ncbi:MAG TPA: hypothetical protein VJ957_08390 [Longimicrobiales bacterium]|nr:hypothetical protein [Longimicrobiales bacterium]